MLNKNVADFTNFQTHRTNKRIVQAPGGSSSINLSWSTNKTDYGSQRYIKGVKQKQYNQRPSQNYSYQESNTYNNIFGGEQNKYNPYTEQGGAYKYNKNSSIGSNNGYNNNYNNGYNYQNQNDRDNIYISQQIDAINFGIRGSEKKSQKNNTELDNKYSNQINKNNYSNNYNHNYGHNYNNNYNTNNNNYNSNYGNNYNSPTNNYNSYALHGDNLAKSSQKYRNEHINQNHNNYQINSNKNLQQIDVAIDQQYNHNKKLGNYANYQYSQDSYDQYKGYGQDKQNYGYWGNNDYSNHGKYGQRVIDSQKMINDYSNNNQYEQPAYRYQATPVRTSVKVHNPPGGKQTLRLG